MAKIPSRPFPKSKTKIPSRKFAKGTVKIASRKFSETPAAAKKKATTGLLDPPANEQARRDRIAILKEQIKALDNSK